LGWDLRWLVPEPAAKSGRIELRLLDSVQRSGLQYVKRSLTDNIPNPDVHTAANEHTNGDGYANGDANSVDHTAADDYKYTAADDSDAYSNTSNSISNCDRPSLGINRRIEKRPRESGAFFLPFLLRLIN